MHFLGAALAFRLDKLVDVVVRRNRDKGVGFGLVVVPRVVDHDLVRVADDHLEGRSVKVVNLVADFRNARIVGRSVAAVYVDGNFSAFNAGVKAVSAFHRLQVDRVFFQHALVAFGPPLGLQDLVQNRVLVFHRSLFDLAADNLSALAGFKNQKVVRKAPTLGSARGQDAKPVALKLFARMHDYVLALSLVKDFNNLVLVQAVLLL